MFGKMELPPRVVSLAQWSVTHIGAIELKKLFLRGKIHLHLNLGIQDGILIYIAIKHTTFLIQAEGYAVAGNIGTPEAPGQSNCPP